jgi:chromate reductase
MAKILAFAGSTRKESYNRRLIELAKDDVTLIDLKGYELPMYDADLEAKHGLPGNAVRLKKLFSEHDALLLACPEYNGSITPLLKNTLDWISRPSGDEPPSAAFQGKVAALISGSPGGLGGMRGLVHVRAILGNMGVIVLPNQLAVPRAHEEFDDKTRAKVAAIVQALKTVAERLHA